MLTRNYSSIPDLDLKFYVMLINFLVHAFRNVLSISVVFDIAEICKVMTENKMCSLFSLEVSCNLNAFKQKSKNFSAINPA